MIRVRTGSRLHFGLFSLPSGHAGPWLNHEGQPTLPRRKFGGVGLMIRPPGINLKVEKSATWKAEGPLAERALHFAQRYCSSVGIADCFHLNILSAAPEHVGLGTGTQLGLGVSSAIAQLSEKPWQEQFAEDLARHIGRGARSAVGIHGFQLSGFIVEAGTGMNAGVAPLVNRLSFPENWRILLVLPRDIKGAHGLQEVDAFEKLAMLPGEDRNTEILCRIVLLNMLPAMFEGDLDTFGEALYDFNRRVGAMFQSVQGGIYAHPRAEQIVKRLRGLGVKGVGQSSWGPAIFAIVPAEQIESIANRLVIEEIAVSEELIITKAWNNGAVVRQK